LDGKPNEIKNRFETVKAPELFKPSYNITPGMMVPVIKKESKVKSAVLAKWGLIPFWAKDPKIGFKMINARAEGIHEKPAYKKPFMSQRCLIPANGFYEWMRIENEKTPYYIKLKSTNLFAMAGLYDIWNDEYNNKIITFTIVTTTPNILIEKIHNRMPVVIPRNIEDKWLDLNNKDIDLLTGMLTAYDQKDMKAYQVSKAVNNPENDYSELTREI